ncbi:MAG: LysR family transcriptional regulator [Lachnospiraceae bacterium]|jgi:DNA-binding transcriptional LysR family regulator|nr:LysR family transcriptional regulator [Lachnospiraceae bacterium]
MEQNLSSYRIFYAVANTGNISKAAKELYISQPAISKSIQKLEENIGVKLFERSSRGVTLTTEGELLYTHVKSAFETLTLGEDKLRRSIALGVGNLTIGVSSTLCKYILLPYLRDFIKKYPHINISIACHSTNHTLKLLEEGKLDIGLVGKPEILRNIDFYPFQEVEDIFVAAKEYLHNLKVRGVERNQILQSATLLLLDKENMTRQYIDGYFQTNHIIPQDTIEVSNMDLLIDMSKIGLGAGCVIRNFVKNELKAGTLLEIPLTIPIRKRMIGFAYNKEVKISKSLGRFIEFYEGYQL